jgi:5-methylthioadenosine/S-adenosylhomocysteine deaminase
MALLIRQASYVVRSADRVERDVDVLIDGRQIAAIGPDLRAQPAAAGDGLVVLDGRQRAVAPGMVNAHTHLYQSFLRGLRSDLGLDDWLQAIVYPFRTAMRQSPAREVEASTARVGCLEMLKNGTTSFIDMESSSEAAWQAWQQVGLRGIVAYTMADVGLPPALATSLQERQERILAFIQAGRAMTERSTSFGMMLAPATPLMCSQALLQWTADMAQRFDLGVHTHAAEAATEVSTVRAEHSASPIGWLDEAGLLSPRTSLAHCIHLSDADRRLICERGAIPVHCPKSNMKLGSGVAPVPELLRLGVHVALANDGPASNDVLDMFEEMRTAALLHKVQGGAAALAPQTAFRMATEYSAQAAQLNAGTLDPGRLADLILVDLDRPHLVPLHDVVSTLVYCAHGSDVETVIVDGRIVLRDRQPVLVDEAEVVGEARAVGAKWYARAFAA